ncbi:MAG: type I methionyl aminopeptidase [Phycisphaeraceae bacterium]|nr:type I methionyl aminopeptidase [Phycisphaeraceae bacterium]
MASTVLIPQKDHDLALAAAQCVVATHRRLVEHIRAGATLAQIDAQVAKILADLGCRSCFLGYKVGRLPPFPSHACLSVNDCVVHGTAGSLLRPLRPGDLVKIDIGVWHQGFIGDAAWTYSIGKPEPAVRALMEAGKESLRRGVAALRPGARLIEFARAVQGHVETERGLHLVRNLGGHGIGRKLHLPPYVSNVVPAYPGEWPEATMTCEPGLLLAVEPMLAIGTGQTKQDGRTWPVRTADGSMSAHYEHDVLVTAQGPRVLTEGLETLPDEV